MSKELEKKIAKLKVAQSQLEVQVSNLEKRKNAGLREQNALLTKNTQLESTKLDLEEAKLQAAGKYDAMEKVRIQTAREKMVLDQGLAGLLVDDVFFFKFFMLNRLFSKR